MIAGLMGQVDDILDDASLDDHAQRTALRELVSRAYRAGGGTSVPDGYGGGVSVPDNDGYVVVWQAPSGLLHHRVRCSGMGRARDSSLVKALVEPWNHEKHCRCMQGVMTVPDQKRV